MGNWSPAPESAPSLGTPWYIALVCRWVQFISSHSFLEMYMKSHGFNDIDIMCIIYIYDVYVHVYVCVCIYRQDILKSIEMLMWYGKIIYQWFLNSRQTHIKNHINWNIRGLFQTQWLIIMSYPYQCVLNQHQLTSTWVQIHVGVDHSYKVGNDFFIPML